MLPATTPGTEFHVSQEPQGPKFKSNRRILCTTWGEEAENKLPVYVAEQVPHIRVEACDTWKFYLRTIDSTKDGHAIPLIDDLAAIPLTLWAHEHGYSRLQRNLLGT